MWLLDWLDEICVQENESGFLYRNLLIMKQTTFCQILSTSAQIYGVFSVGPLIPLFGTYCGIWPRLESQGGCAYLYASSHIHLDYSNSPLSAIPASIMVASMAHFSSRSGSSTLGLFVFKSSVHTIDWCLILHGFPVRVSPLILCNRDIYRDLTIIQIYFWSNRGFRK